MDRKTQKHILNALRKGTTTWPGRSKCLKAASKKVFSRVGKNGKEILKTYWQCAKCCEWFRNESDMEVDHKVEVGGFRGDWNTIVTRMYDENNLQALCIECHSKKTNTFNASLRYQRKT